MVLHLGEGPCCVAADLRELPRSGMGPEERDWGLKSVLCVPLPRDGVCKPAGWLYCSNRPRGLSGCSSSTFKSGMKTACNHGGGRGTNRWLSVGSEQWDERRGKVRIRRGETPYAVPTRYALDTPFERERERRTDGNSGGDNNNTGTCR